MDNKWFFKSDEIVVWNGIILPYRFFYSLFDENEPDNLRLAEPEEVELYKQYAR